MTNQLSYISICLRLGALLTVIASATLWVPTLHSLAQQDNRQLTRDQSQSNKASEWRLALVIGNGLYTNAPPLKNPPNDARDMAATLKTLGFEVASGINVNQRDMKRLIREFGQSLKSGGSGLFYYAGHGVQSKGHNYLVPVDADIQSEAEVEDTGVDVNLVLNYMDDAQNGLNIVILDACRNNPFGRGFRSAGSGLAQVDAPTGTLIAYATAPGRVASDGDGRNGLYTSELLKQMRQPGLSATDMFMQVRAEVMKKTDNKQVPWEASSLIGRFYFSATPTNTSSSNSGVAVQPAKIDSVAVEREYWETIRNSIDAEDYKDYLQAYPSGAYIVIARAKIKLIQETKEAKPNVASLNSSNAGRVNNGSTSAPSTGTNESVMQELLNWEQQYFDATLRGDRVTAGSMMADEAVTIQDGKSSNKKQLISTVKKQDAQWSFSYESVSVSFEGDNAVLSGIVIFKNQSAKTMQTTRQRFKETFVKLGYRWLLLKSEVTTLK